MVLLSDDRPFDAQAFTRQFRSDWPEAGSVGNVSVSDCVTSVDVGDHTVMIAQMPVAIPDFSVPADRLYLLWPDAAKEVPTHQRHWIVTLTGPGDKVLDRARVLTKAVHSLLASHPFALGITWGSQANLVSRTRFQQVASDLRDGDDPFLLWVDVQCGWRPEGAASGRSVGLTRGLKDFDLMDFETLDAYESPSDLYTRLVDLIEYVLSNGPVIRDGDTIGQDANEKIRVVYAQSSFGMDARVMRLEYATPAAAWGGHGGYPPASPVPSPFSPGVANSPGAANPWSAGVPSDHPAATVNWTPSSSPYESSSLSPLAAFSLVLAVLAPVLMCFCFLHVPVLILSAILGHLAVYQVGRSNGRLYGSGIAILALVIDYLLLLGTIAFAFYLFVWAPSTRTNTPTPVVPIQTDPPLDIPLDAPPSPPSPTDPSQPPPNPASPNSSSPKPEIPGFDPPTIPPFVPPTTPPVTPPTTPPPTTPPSTTPPATSPPGTSPPSGIPPNDNPFAPVDPAPERPKKTGTSSQTKPGQDAAEPDPATVKLKVPELGWSVMSLAFSRDGRQLAVGKLDSSLLVFDVESGEQRMKRERITKLGQVAAVAFAPSGDVVYAGGWSGAIESFSLTDANAAPTSLAGHTRNARCLEVSPDGRFLISGSDDGHVTWQVPGEPTKVRTLQALPGHVMAVKLATPPVTAWATDGKTVVTIDLRAAKVTATDSLTKNYVHAAAFSHDGKQVSASLGSDIAVWSIGTPNPIARLATRSEMQWSVQFTPDKRYLLSGGQGKVAVWDVASQTKVTEYKLASPLYVKTLAISPDSRLVAAIPEAAGQTLFVFKLPESNK